MKFFTLIIFVILGLSFCSVFFVGCMHDPLPAITNPIDTNTNPIDTNITDTVITKQCDSNKIYFKNQILPIFQSNCALSGCHDAIKHEEGIILDSYDNIIKTGNIRAFDISHGDIYERISSRDPNKRMPPPPMNVLSLTQQNLISEWILQGATNDSCDILKDCEVSSVSFMKDVMPIIDKNCKVCHSGNQPLGNLSLTNYTEIKSIVSNGKLVCVINWNTGCSQMPKGGKKLDSCSIRQIEAWINQGGLNN